MKKYYFIVLALFILITSCNREVVVIKGKLIGYNNSSVRLKLNTKAGYDKAIASNLKIEDELIEAYIENEKPPFKLTLVIDNEQEVDFWIFKYGKFNLELSADNLDDFKINDSFENSELARVKDTYSKMYLKPIRKQMDWVVRYESEEHENVDEADEAKLERYKVQIKKAYSLKKKSILKTIRKAPQNPISMALFFDEFERLTKWQKKECCKLAQKYYSDTGMNWQLKH